MIPNTVKIEVIDFNNRTLAPTSRYRHVRHLLKSGRATIVCRAPFTIKLLYNHQQPSDKMADLKNKIGYAKFISKYPESRDFIDLSVEILSGFDAKSLDVFCFEVIVTLAQKFQKQAHDHTIHYSKRYIRKMYQNVIESYKLGHAKLIFSPRTDKFRNFIQRPEEYWDKAFEEVLRQSYDD